MDSSVIYIFALIIISLVLLAVGVLALYLKLLNKYDELKHGKDTQPVDPEVLLSQARQRSQAILEEAHTKAQTIVGSAEAYLKHQDSVIGSELTKAQTEYEKAYKEMIQASGAKAQQMMQNIPQDIKMTLISAIDNFRVSLTSEIGKAQEEANRAIREAYQKAADDVSLYKEERMKQIDKGILEIVKEVTEKVLAKSISVEEHEKLVQKALEEVKKQKII